MSLENRISVEISEDTIQKVLAAVLVIETELPFLLNLTSEQRRSLPKMGDKTVSFVTKSLDYARQNASVVPQFLDLAEFEKDVSAVGAITRMVNPIRQLAEKLDDTGLVAGSEAYAAALVFYNATKAAVKAGVPGMKSVVDDLSARFPGRSSNTPTSSGSAAS